jgi:hypothetical protein|nr:MAG TPA: tail component protein [Caudoviricetes sp.]
MGKTIKLNLFSDKSIQNAIKALRDYENSLTYKCRLLAERLAEKGVEVARIEVTSLDAIFTGDLMRSIHAEHIGNIKGGGIWAVVADDKSAVFVEFGTLGSLGGKKEYPYPLPEGVQWNYGSGSNIIQLTNGQYGWFYKGDDGKVYWCEGMDSRPFMYLTGIELEKDVVKVAMEVFVNGG